MTISSSESLLVGIIALALVPLIGWRIVRGVRNGRLPVYRTCLSREDRPAAFGLLLALHGLSLLLVAGIGVDLLFNLGLRGAL